MILYNNLSTSYNVKISLIPDTSKYKGINMIQCQNIYEQLDDIMKTYLLYSIITKDNFPKYYQLFKRNRNIDDVFKILKRIIFGLCSQLGWIYEDPQ